MPGEHCWSLIAEYCLRLHIVPCLIERRTHYVNYRPWFVLRIYDGQAVASLHAAWQSTRRKIQGACAVLKRTPGPDRRAHLHHLVVADEDTTSSGSA